MDRNTQAIVEQYAEGLSQFALEKNLVSDIQTELAACLSVFEETDLSTYLSSLALAHDDKIALISLLQKELSTYLKNFLTVILNNGRESLIEPIFRTVLDKLRQETREFPLTVTTAVPLSDSQQERLLKLGKQRFDIEAKELKQELDQAIIGGFVLKANNQIIDTSIRSQLQQLKNNLK
ncbi:F0F1 ATP synthase subunit delta [Streptococcus dentasini]